MTLRTNTLPRLMILVGLVLTMSAPGTFLARAQTGTTEGEGPTSAALDPVLGVSAFGNPDGTYTLSATASDPTPGYGGRFTIQVVFDSTLALVPGSAFIPPDPSRETPSYTELPSLDTVIGQFTFTTGSSILNVTLSFDVTVAGPVAPGTDVQAHVSMLANPDSPDQVVRERDITFRLPPGLPSLTLDGIAGPISKVEGRQVDYGFPQGTEVAEWSGPDCSGEPTTVWSATMAQHSGREEDHTSVQARWIDYPTVRSACLTITWTAELGVERRDFDVYPGETVKVPLIGVASGGTPPYRITRISQYPETGGGTFTYDEPADMLAFTAPEQFMPLTTTSIFFVVEDSVLQSNVGQIYFHHKLAPTPTPSPTMTPTATPSPTFTPSPSPTTTPVPSPTPSPSPSPEPIAATHLTVSGDPRFPITGSAAIPGHPGLTYSPLTPPAIGSVIIAPSGSFTYTAPATLASGDQFTVLASGPGGQSAVVTITIDFAVDKTVPTYGKVGRGDGGNGGETASDVRSGAPVEPAPTAEPTSEPGTLPNPCARCN